MPKKQLDENEGVADRPQYASRLSESQERRLQAAKERGGPTKKQRNRDYKTCPRGSLATD